MRHIVDDARKQARTLEPEERTAEVSVMSGCHLALIAEDNPGTTKSQRRER
jgi:hypothetical protein